MATAKKSAKSGSLTVTAPLVQLRVGDRVVQFSEGDVLPENADKEGLDHLRDLGFVSEGDAAAESDEK